MVSFRPPSVFRPVAGGHRLWQFYAQDKGLSVLKIDGAYYTVENPSLPQIAAASEVYMGGHEYDVTADVAQALVDAGYVLAGNVGTDNPSGPSTTTAPPGGGTGGGGGSGGGGSGGGGGGSGGGGGGGSGGGGGGGGGTGGGIGDTYGDTY